MPRVTLLLRDDPNIIKSYVAMGVAERGFHFDLVAIFWHGWQGHPDGIPNRSTSRKGCSRESSYLSEVVVLLWTLHADRDSASQLQYSVKELITFAKDMFEKR